MKPAVEATFRTPPRRRATMPGSTRPVSSTSEVMFSWIIARSAASSRSTAKRPWPPTPALFTSTSISRWPSAVITVLTALGWARSATTCSAEMPCVELSSSAAAASLSALRATRIRSYRSAAASRASSRPMPPEAPVTRASGRADDAVVIRLCLHRPPRPVSGRIYRRGPRRGPGRRSTARVTAAVLLTAARFVGSGENRQLLAQLAALTDAVTRLRENQDRAAQATATRRAAEQLRLTGAQRASVPPGAPAGAGRSLNWTRSGPTEVGGEIWLTAAGCGTQPHSSRAARSYSPAAAWAASDFLAAAGRVVEGRRGGPLTDPRPRRRADRCWRRVGRRDVPARQHRLAAADRPEQDGEVIGVPPGGEPTTHWDQCLRLGRRPGRVRSGRRRRRG